MTDGKKVKKSVYTMRYEINFAQNNDKMTFRKYT